MIWAIFMRADQATLVPANWFGAHAISARGVRRVACRRARCDKLDHSRLRISPQIEQFVVGDTRMHVAGLSLA
jgi:hypothetical protein